MHGSGGIEMKFPWQTMVQLRSLSFTAIGRTQHDTTWTRENFQKKIATTGMGFPRKKWRWVGGLHVSRDSSVRKRNSPGPRSFSQGPKFWCEIKIGIKSTMKPAASRQQ